MHARTAGADAAGLQVNIHAIGDRANRLLLDIYERVEREAGPRDRRFPVEHAQHLHPDDIPRFARLDVIPSMQPYHAIDDGRWAEGVSVPAQKITVEEALRAHTVDAAYAAFADETLGSLQPGKLADVGVLERDLTAVPPEEIRDVRVLRTIVGGESVFIAEQPPETEPAGG